MKTVISERKLMELRVLGSESNRRFVDPAVLRHCATVLTARGEQWAASVLGRDITRRSLIVSGMPFLRSGEEYTLVLADAEEDRVVLGETS